MTKDELLAKMAAAVAEMEGFFLTQEEAKARGAKWPTKAQRTLNPGNIRMWRDKYGTPYPTTGDGFVDFLAWAKNNLELLAEAEGWRVLKTQLDRFVSGRRTGGKIPTIREIFHIYAPKGDGNNPDKYAEFVARKIGIDPDVSLKEVLDAGEESQRRL